MVASSDFLEIELKDVEKYVEKGFIVYVSQKKDSGSGHIETVLPKNVETIDENGNSMNTSTLKYYSVGAGAANGAAFDFIDNKNHKKKIYLGYLKK